MDVEKKTRTSIIACLAVCWACCLGAQTGSNSLIIHLQTISSTTIEITERNNSSQEIYFSCGKPNMKIYVLKGDGSPAEDTQEGITYKAAEHGEHSNSQTVCVTGSMKPGQTVRYPMDVSRLYKINRPDKYTVGVEQNVDGISTVKSNTVVLAMK
jgi:hypothetical protein